MELDLTLELALDQSSSSTFHLALQPHAPGVGGLLISWNEAHSVAK